MLVAGRGSTPSERTERRRIIDAGSHPSVEEIKEAVQSKDGTLVCPVCGREEFALEEVTVLGPGWRSSTGRAGGSARSWCARTAGT